MSSLPSGIQGSTTCLAHWENVRTVLELYLYTPDATIHPWEHLATLPTDRIVLGYWKSTSMATWLCRKILVPDVCQSLTCFTHASEAETFHRRCQQWRIPTPSRAASLTLTTRCGNVKLSCFVCSDGCKYFILPLTRSPRHMTVESTVCGLQIAVKSKVQMSRCEMYATESYERRKTLLRVETLLKC